MSQNNEQKQPGYAGQPQHQATMNTPANHTPVPTAASHYKQQVGSIPESESFIQEKTSSHSITLPATPLLSMIPWLRPIVTRIKNATGMNLGVTYKGSVSSENNGDVVYKADFAGIGLVGSPNIQIAPETAVITTKAKLSPDAHLGYNASALSAPLGIGYERLAGKVAINGGEAFSFGPEASIQKPSLKPVTAVTFGIYPEDTAKFRIPAKLAQPLKEWVVQPLKDNWAKVEAQGPSEEEWKIIKERALPFYDAADEIERIVGNSVEIVGALKNSAISAITSKLNNTAQSNEQKAHYVVNPKNTLNIIGEKNGQSSAVDNQPYAPSYKVQVKPGDNLWDIAAREKGDASQYKAIAEKNHIKDPDSILPTKEKNLVIPGYQKSNEEEATYTVRDGDTLENIGQRTGHTSAEIFALNKKMLKGNHDLIIPGQELLIPEDHAALICHPLVQERIREIKSKQQSTECTR